MEFNREIPIAENYKFERKEYDYLLKTIHEEWDENISNSNVAENTYNYIRNMWCFGIFE